MMDYSDITLITRYLLRPVQFEDSLHFLVLESFELMVMLF